MQSTTSYSIRNNSGLLSALRRDDDGNPEWNAKKSESIYLGIHLHICTVVVLFALSGRSTELLLPTQLLVTSRSGIPLSAVQHPKKEQETRISQMLQMTK